MRRMTTEEFINKSTAIHGDKYCYEKVEYIKNNIHVNILCKKHGLFKQKPSYHLTGRGCKMCKFDKLSDFFAYNNNIFIKKSFEKHGNKYDYSLVDYKRSTIKVKIICNIHGMFEQTRVSHIKGSGCLKCHLEKSNYNEFHKENPSRWTKSNWSKASILSKNFDSFKVYIIKCWNENEEFYKIGRTFTKINKRFNGKSKIPYMWSICNVFVFETPGDCFDFEVLLKKKNKKNKYLPKKHFSGIQECFNIVDITNL